jgi:crossover junction endodeoxyribonuclease RuvC
MGAAAKVPKTVRILGIDPGLRVTGFGLVDRDGQSLRYVTSGVIRTPEGELPARLAAILEGIAEVIRSAAPDHSAIEKVFVNVNPQSTLLLGQARGAAICALVLAGLPVSEYTALQTKQATVGHGKASKDQVQQMVQRLLRLPGLPSPDAADALACAICHANASAAVAALGTLAPGVGRRGLRMRSGRITG